jgi:hypothetical protein
MSNESEENDQQRSFRGNAQPSTEFLLANISFETSLALSVPCDSQENFQAAPGWGTEFRYHPAFREKMAFGKMTNRGPISRHTTIFKKLPLSRFVKVDQKYDIRQSDTKKCFSHDERQCHHILSKSGSTGWSTWTP